MMGRPGYEPPRWADDLPEPHVVELVCRCPDPDACATNALVADRNTGWKEFFRVRGELEELRRSSAEVTS